MKEIKGHENYLIDEAGNIFSKKSNKFVSKGRMFEVVSLSVRNM